MPAATPEDQKAISEVYDALWALVKRRTKPEQFPEFVATLHPENAVELAGNTDGLLLLAAYALRTAIALRFGDGSKRLSSPCGRSPVGCAASYRGRSARPDFDHVGHSYLRERRGHCHNRG